MAADRNRGRPRPGRRQAAVPPPPVARGRDGHPSRSLTVVHDGADRVDTVGLWLSALRAAHQGDEVGCTRVGLATSGTYTVRM